MVMSLLLVDALVTPSLVLKLSNREWDLLIRQARRANLLGRLAWELRSCGFLEECPESPRNHLNSVLKVVDRQSDAVRWEVQCIVRALAPVCSRIVLLKGAAYLIAGMPVASGRMFTDVDILVPKHQLGEVEDRLFMNGWQSAHHNEYDQRYYRRWMHEIPPLIHRVRGTAIDVHHNILPATGRIKVHSEEILKHSLLLQGESHLAVLSLVDMVLHSATHLFHEGEFGNGLRDLFDLDSLLRSSSEKSEFWCELVPRATALGLTRPLWYALRYSKEIIGTPIPASVLLDAEVGKPSDSAVIIMDYCMRRALLPMHSSCKLPGDDLARFLLYVRSHWLRMPLHLLLYHFTRKAFRRDKSNEKKLDQNEQLI